VHADTATTEFPVTYCASCERDVLCVLDLDDRDQQLPRCFECGTAADPASLRSLALADLEGLGYGYVLPEGGCGRPDCGGGRCGRSDPEDERPH
jgi:hypothetical protein